MEFQGRVALVTGGSKGIGRGIALGLAAQGAAVAVSARHLETLQPVVAEIKGTGARAMAVQADVSRAGDVRAMFEQVAATLGPVDILVNNAGVYLTATVLEMTEADWDTTVDIDLKGVFLCSQLAGRAMAARGSGRIINISSIAQYRGGTPGHAHYGAAKAGMGGFTKTLAKELGPHGITVNCVAPGLIEDTELGETAKALVGPGYLATIPLGYLGKVQDIVEAVLFLASERARYITGETINVNGGSHMV